MKHGFLTRGHGAVSPGRAGASAGAGSPAPAPTSHRRGVLLLGLTAALAAATLVAPGTAQAAPGDGPGGMTLLPDHGSTTAFPIASYTTANPCPTTNRAMGFVNLLQSDGLSALAPVGQSFTPSDTPPSGSLNANTLDGALSGKPSGVYEIAVLCRDAAGADVVADSVWITVNMAAQTWQLRQAGGGVVATTTTLTVAPVTADQGADVTLTATVAAASGSPAGAVEFRNGATPLGSAAVASGAASKVVNSLPVGANSITAVFTPTDAAAFAGSTSSAVPVTINSPGGSLKGTETITVNVPSSSGPGEFKLTVSTTAVAMSDATSDGTNLNSSGTLSPVTVADTRTSKPGWSLSGQVDDFVSGGNTIDANALGWVPLIATPNAAGDVVKGAAVAPGTNPGLKQGAGLATADAGKGAGTTTLGAALTLKAPDTTPPGSYTTTLTLSAMTSG